MITNRLGCPVDIYTKFAEVGRVYGWPQDLYIYSKTINVRGYDHSLSLSLSLSLSHSLTCTHYDTQQ